MTEYLIQNFTFAGAGVINSVVHSSFGYKDQLSQLLQKSASDFQDFMNSAVTSLLEEVSSMSIVLSGGAACVLAFFSGWRICKQLSRRIEISKETCKQTLLNSIKRAYNPAYSAAVIEQLQQSGVEINETVSSSGLTFFLCGCLSGNEDVVLAMLKRGADVESETHDGDSPLYLATYAVLHSSEPNVGTLRILLRAGCNVNKQNRRGYTPLHRAASKGCIKVIQFLLSEGADPYIANNAGVYPIDSAVCAGHTEAARLLKLKFPSPYVWDVVEPHTPPHIKMGLQSPQRKLMLNSSRASSRLQNVFA